LIWHSGYGDANEIHPRTNFTPLIVACKNYGLDAMRILLLEYAVDVNHRVATKVMKGKLEWFTPLCYVIFNRHIRVEGSAILLGYGADVKASSIHPVEVAIYLEAVNVVESYFNWFPQCKRVACDAYVQCVLTKAFKSKKPMKQSGLFRTLVKYGEPQIRQACLDGGLDFMAHMNKFADVFFRPWKQAAAQALEKQCK